MTQAELIRELVEKLLAERDKSISTNFRIRSGLVI